MNKSMRVLAVATERGSAKALVPVLIYMKSQGVEMQVYFPQDVLDFMLGLDTWKNVRLYALTDQNQAETIMESISPDVILLGTGSVACVERKIVVLARRRNIKTVSVIDERWAFSNWRNRV